MKIKSLVFHLTAENNGFLHKYNGPLMRAAFLKIIQNQNPSLADNLHDTDKRSPYYITSLKPSPFINVKTGKNRKEYQVRTGQKYFSKINVLEEDVFKTLISGLFTDSNLKKIRIGNIYFSIDNIEVNSYGLDDLLKKDVTNVKISFNSPTFFKTTDGAAGIEYFPRPTTIFKFIVNQWNSFPVEEKHMPPTDFLDWIRKNVKISSFKIRTDSSHVMKKVPIMGTIGWVKYSWKNEENISKWIPILLKYAELTGLGGLRTAGYGEIEVMFGTVKGSKTK